MKLNATLALALAALTFSCGSTTKPAETSKTFGTIDGTPVQLYTLESPQLLVTITNYGGRVVEIRTPDKTHTDKASWTNISNGFEKAEDYIVENPYFGALIGRYGNRIGKGKFTLEGKEYTLAQNNNGNSLHGGLKGFDKRIWNAVVDKNQLVLTYTSADGEEGYPGKLTATVVYSVVDNELHIDYQAVTDKTTVVNLTNHTYFNLNGAGEGDVLGHQVTINADKYTPIDAGLIPTGELAPVEGTPFDFRTAHAIGERIAAKDQQIEYGKGYDHNWVLRDSGGKSALAAVVYSPASGRNMEVYTNEPGLQFYTGNFLDGKNKGIGGKAYNYRGAFCMETQHFPDSPNKPNFPSTVLKPGDTYKTSTYYKFSVK